MSIYIVKSRQLTYNFGKGRSTTQYVHYELVIRVLEPKKSKQKIMSLFLCPQKNSKRKPLCILQTNDSSYLLYIVNPHAGTNPSSLTHSRLFTLFMILFAIVFYHFPVHPDTASYHNCCLRCVPNFPFVVLLFKLFTVHEPTQRAKCSS